MKKEYKHINDIQSDKCCQDGVNAQATERLEQIGRILYPELLNDIDDLRKENKELKETSEKYKTLKDAFAEQTIQLNQCKRDLIKAQELIRVTENCKKTGDATLSYDFVYDLGDFDPDFTRNDIETFFNNLYFLACKKGKYDNYLIENSMAVVPIFIIFTQDTSITNTKWAFKSDLKSFCEYWNLNVAKRMNDPERRKALTCDYNTIKAELNKQPWKNANPVSWRRMADEKRRYKNKLNKAATIRSEVNSRYA